MDRTFKEMCQFFTPKMTDEVMNGYICHEVRSHDPQDKGNDYKAMEDRVHATIRKAFHGLFDGRLVVKDYVRCSPQEEFDFATRPRNNKRTFELAKSDVYLTKIVMGYYVGPNQLEPLPEVYLYLPCPGEAGLMMLGGSMYQLIPSVSDKVISSEGDYLFVRLDQYKMKFFQKGPTVHNYPVVFGNEVLFHDVYWSNIYNQRTSKKSGEKKAIVTKAVSTLAHYLFARLGFRKTFERYAGYVPHIGTEKEINEKTYPVEDWVICKSSFNWAKPPTVIGDAFEKNEIRVAIPRGREKEHATRSLIHGFFYITDAFPRNLKADSVEVLEAWKLTLGQIISDPRYTPGTIFSIIDEHFGSIDTYMDEDSIDKMREKGIDVNNFTDLLGLITVKYPELFGDPTRSQVIYGKYLDTMREMLFPITRAIYSTKYELLKKGSKGPPNFNTVRDVFTRFFKPRPIFKLASEGIVAEPCMYGADDKYSRITSRLNQQETTPTKSGAKTKKSSNTADINTSQIMTGSILFISKSKPVPMSHINPYIKLDANGTILENEKYKEILDKVDDMLIQKS